MNAQEQFWAKDGGVAYTTRNRVNWRARIPFWKMILGLTGARSVYEVGCNSGWNLSAICRADPLATVSGCDINPAAVDQACAAGLRAVLARARDIGEWMPNRQELVFTAGVLIHIPPTEVLEVMSSVMHLSSDYVLAIEYEATEEKGIEYRGSADLLWKRPFGEMYKNLGLDLVAQGEAEGFDRCTYWLLRKP